jgi:hypothetical protein
MIMTDFINTNPTKQMIKSYGLTRRLQEPLVYTKAP